MIKLLYITRRLACVVILPLLMAMAPAMAQTVVYVGDTTPLTVVAVPGNTYLWELYSDGTVNFATVPGNCPATSADFVGGNTGPAVNVKWIKTGIYYFKVTASDGCTNNLKIGMIEVKEALPTATISPPEPICIVQTASIQVTLTGTAPWEVTFTDGSKTWTETGITQSQYLLVVNPKTTTSYWITQVKDLNATNTVTSQHVTLQVNPKPASSKIYLYQP